MPRLVNGSYHGLYVYIHRFNTEIELLEFILIYRYIYYASTPAVATLQGDHIVFAVDNIVIFSFMQPREQKYR